MALLIPNAILERRKFSYIWIGSMFIFTLIVSKILKKYVTIEKTLFANIM